jgi:hypothetical protein
MQCEQARITRPGTNKPDVPGLYRGQADFALRNDTFRRMFRLIHRHQP